MKKILALILAALMLFLSVGCTQKEEPTAAPDKDVTEQDNETSPDEAEKTEQNETDNPDAETDDKAAQILDNIRSRRWYVEEEIIENDRCYVFRGYFMKQEYNPSLKVPLNVIGVVYKYGGARDLTSAVYQHFTVVDSIAFSEEKDYILTVKGRVLSEDNETYTDATAEFNIYSYPEPYSPTVTPPPQEPQDPKAAFWRNLPSETQDWIRLSLSSDPTSPYSRYVERLVDVPGTFSDNAWGYVNTFVVSEDKSDHTRPALLWYLAQEMDLTREDFEAYFAAFDSYYASVGYLPDNIATVPERIYEGLMADTLEESMQLLKSDLAFYYDGKLYTVYDIYEMYENGTLPFDITDSAYDEVWKNISFYLEVQQYEVMPRDIYLFVRERAHDPVDRIYFYFSPQYQCNMCCMHFISNNYSVLDCDNYEVSVDSMNDRYALVRDGTYFIYDYMSGEKVYDIPLSPDEYIHIDFVDFSSVEFPRYLSVGIHAFDEEHHYVENSCLLYDTEKQAFVSDERFKSCIIPEGTDLLCKTVSSDGKDITTAYRAETLEEVFSVEGNISSVEIEGKTVLAVRSRDADTQTDVTTFYDTDGNKLTGLDKYRNCY